MKYSAWLAKAAKQPTVREAVDLGPLGVEDVEVAVESCGLCHSDLPVLNNAVARRPSPTGHEAMPAPAAARAMRTPTLIRRDGNACSLLARLTSARER